MIDLSAIPFFAGLSSRNLERLERLADRRNFPSGSIVCRKGDDGRSLYAVASGGVAVKVGERPGSPGSQFFLGPGEIFGEMSIISGLPVSATIVTTQSTVLHCVSREAFLELLESDTALQAALSRMLIDRIRERTSSASPTAGRGACAVVVLPDGADDAAERCLAAVLTCLERYAPGSLLARSAASEEALQTIETWRDSAGSGQYLMLLTDTPTAAKLSPSLIHEDALLTVGVVAVDGGLAGDATMLIARDDSFRRPREGTWSFVLSTREAESVLAGTARDRHSAPDADRIARWIARREVGFALGSGAARGFAHLGVLEVLEDAGVPIDCIAGTSMGGIVGLGYGRAGNARGAIEITRECIGANGLVRDYTWFPRSGFLAGNKVRRAAQKAGAGLHFSELQRPIFVAAADLVRSERVAIDSGAMEQALVATGAIPGVFPPVVSGDRVMVDGAIVSRIPLDLLQRRRCGLTVAVNVIPEPAGASGDVGARAQAMQASVGRFLGLREVISRSWELLGWWHGAADAAAADILIEPTTRSAGYDFDRFDEMVEDGRQAARAKLPSVMAAVERLLRTG